MIQGIELSDLTMLRFSIKESAQLNWHHDEEFEWCGEKYDVVHRTESGDSILYWCWWDHEESELERKLEALLRQGGGDIPLNDEPASLLVDFMKKCCNDPALDSMMESPLPEVLQWTVILPEDLVSSVPPLTPPPDIV